MINILTILVLLCFIAFFIFLIARPKNEHFIDDNTNVLERFTDPIKITFTDATTTKSTETFYLITMPNSNETYLGGKYELDTSSTSSTSLQWKLHREDNFYNYKDTVVIKYDETPINKLRSYIIYVNKKKKYIYNGDKRINRNIQEIYNNSKSMWEDINTKQKMSFFLNDTNSISLDLINESVMNMCDLNIYSNPI